MPGSSEVADSPAPPRDERPSASGGPPGSGQDNRSIPELMVCHPDARGPFAAADVIQECINRAPAFSSIEIPPGTYLLTHQIVVSTPLTIRTAGSGGTSLSCAGGSDQCAILAAAPNLLTTWGLVVVWSTNNVTLEHVVIDGNRAARTASTAAEFCLTRGNVFGYNASVVDCLNCGLDDVVSRNALCGTGMVWSGAQATIQRSAFLANGDRAAGLWSDGLTLIYAPRSVIRANEFVDNSDVALIMGYGVQSRVEQNVVLQRTQSAFAGLMLDNFNSNDLSVRGDFRGAVIANNTVDCGPQLCAFGIQVGPHPWYPTKNIVGGELRDNQVLGAKIGINVDGAGVWTAPTAIFANSVSPAPSGSYFSECAQPIPAEWMNVAPASIIDRRDEVNPAGSHLSESCELWSDLSH
jgi:nitrous oxidase accessory protein NosD